MRHAACGGRRASCSRCCAAGGQRRDARHLGLLELSRQPRRRAALWPAARCRRRPQACSGSAAAAAAAAAAAPAAQAAAAGGGSCGQQPEPAQHPQPFRLRGAACRLRGGPWGLRGLAGRAVVTTVRGCPDCHLTCDSSRVRRLAGRGGGAWWPTGRRDYSTRRWTWGWTWRPPSFVHKVWHASISPRCLSRGELRCPVASCQLQHGCARAATGTTSSARCSTHRHNRAHRRQQRVGAPGGPIKPGEGHPSGPTRAIARHTHCI